MYLFKYMHEALNPSVINFADDYSGGTTEIHVGPDDGANEFWILNHLSVIIEDGARFAPSKFGAMDALTNGISVPLLYGAIFKTNRDLFEGADTTQSTADVFDSTSTYEYKFVYSFTHTGQPFIISDQDLDYPQFFTAELSDDLSDLTSFKIVVHGERVQYNDRNHSIIHYKYMSPHEFE